METDRKAGNRITCNRVPVHKEPYVCNIHSAAFIVTVITISSLPVECGYLYSLPGGGKNLKIETNTLEISNTILLRWVFAMFRKSPFYKNYCMLGMFVYAQRIVGPLTASRMQPKHH